MNRFNPANGLKLLFPVPETCAFCDRRAHRNGICKLCLNDMLPIEGKICERCGRPFDQALLCPDCYRRPDTYFACNRSAVQYNEKMKQIISLYKFRGDESLSYALSQLLEEAYRRHYAAITFDCLTFVPLHEQRLAERGFNQAQQLALQLSLRTNIPLVNLLKRTRLTGKQSQQQRADRLRNLTGAFQLLPHPAPIRRVLLIDDVYTTGSTVNECAKVLAREGTIVYSLTVAR